MVANALDPDSAFEGDVRPYSQNCKTIIKIDLSIVYVKSWVELSKSIGRPWIQNLSSHTYVDRLVFFGKSEQNDLNMQMM